MSGHDISGGTGAKLVRVNAPLLLATTACLLSLRATPLPRYTHTWVHYLFTCCRRNGKKNQFGLSEANYNYIAIFLVVVPPFAYFMATMDRRLIGEDVTNERKLRSVANTAGIVGVLCLSFFIIPVARHSVLIVAMGWSPVHALRIHVWAGFASFFWIMLHGILYICDWFLYHDESVLEQIIPGSECWAWKPTRELSEEDIERGRSPHSLSGECSDQFYNFTGLIALLFFVILCATSLNWFRRKYYRLFYIFHMTFGVGMLVGAVAHWNSLVTYLLPSIVYYLASTAPVLIQAVASRFRGGVQIKKIVHLLDAGGCKEVQVATAPETNAALDNQPSMFVKLCVPSISLVWHPFTVYKHENDPTTVRFLFRPVGPFTKKLATGLEQDRPPVTILDGLYHTGNRCLEALQHDHVTIVCGGVAITPFLTMIPSILKTLSKASADYRTKKLVLHWACRERGLVTYVVENYFKSMKLAADSMSFDLEIIIHQTGKSKTLDPDIRRESSDELKETKELSSMNKSFGTDPTENSQVERKSSASSADAEDEVPADDTRGHTMELGRFMPARYTKIWHNIPTLVAVGGSMWLFFYIIWYYYDVYDFVVHENLARTWGLAVCFLSAIGLGIFFEGSALVAARKLAANASPQKSFETAEYAPTETLEVGSPTFEYRAGRPNVQELFRGASESEYPAIFMCGPVAMTAMVKGEARKRNSIFGFTGMSLYEEPFEM